MPNPRRLRWPFLALALAVSVAARETEPPAEKPSPVRPMADRLTLREPFNQAKGKTRIIAFLSPSCPRCLKNAGEIQREILAKNPDAPLAVFVVWLKALQSDNELAVESATETLPDRRVVHYWDPERVLNAQLLDAITFDVNLRIYDVFLLYGGTTSWEKRLPRPGYWMHEMKGAPGPWWDVTTFASEVGKGLRGQPFTPPYN
jgi:hypothetical protein